jgi:RNA polymerase subunit RPABC4/transcription elongation factor Spt4
MALVKCKECGVQVSTKAQNCPNCGAKAPKKTSLFTWLVLIVIIVAGWSAIQSPSTKSPSTARTSTAAGTGNPSSTVARTPAAAPTWSSFTSKDEMTGELSAYATSPRVPSNSPMDFPYHGTKAWLGVGCDGKSEWVYFGFTESPNLNNTDTEDGYNVVRTRVRWNSTVEPASFIQKWGDNALHFRNHSAAISRIARSTSIMLELDWHGQRPVHFEIPLNGSSKAIQEMRQKCRT